MAFGPAPVARNVSVLCSWQIKKRKLPSFRFMICMSVCGILLSRSGTGGGIRYGRKQKGENDLRVSFFGGRQTLRVESLEGTLVAPKNGFIIKGIDGEIWGIDGEIFKKTYDIIE